MPRCATRVGAGRLCTVVATWKRQRRSGRGVGGDPPHEVRVVRRRWSGRVELDWSVGLGGWTWSNRTTESGRTGRECQSSVARSDYGLVA
eukprot:2265297-Prymnesium_polylepis.1